MKQPLTNTLKRKAEEAGDQWTRELLDNPPADLAAWHEEIRSTITTTARAAFTLYAIAWGPGYNVKAWRWPFDALAETKGGKYERPERPFDGAQPWCILFRYAIKLAVQPTAEN